MVYDFNCTECGKLLTQDTVLYDFLSNLYIMKNTQFDSSAKGDAGQRQIINPFSRLRVRLLLSELLEMMGDQRNDKAPSVCWLDFKQMMRYIGNARNLNIEGLENLTLEDVRRFASSDDEEIGADAAELFDRILMKQMENSSGKNDDVRKEDLRKEFRDLLDLFGKESEVEFGLELVRDIVNREAITGFNLYNTIDGRVAKDEVHECRNPRLCSASAGSAVACGTPVFDRAGAARQIKIGFIGKQGAGKTSAILAVAYALINRNGKKSGDDMLDLAECIKKHRIYPVNSSNNPLTEKELENYAKGLAPAKTKRGKGTQTDSQETQISKAYAFTLQLRDDLLVTLTDIPGEAFNEENGTVDGTVLNAFESTLYVDAFVFCYDASAPGGQNRIVELPADFRMVPDDMKPEIAEIVQQLNAPEEKKTSAMPDHTLACRWLKEIARKWADKNDQDSKMPPVLILYMKDPSLEDQSARESVVKEGKDDYVYCGIFPGEQLALDTETLDKRYGAFREQYQQESKSYYYTELRCSPYGFAAPNLENARKRLRDISGTYEQIRRNLNHAEMRKTDLTAKHAQCEEDLMNKKKLLGDPAQLRSYFTLEWNNCQNTKNKAELAHCEALKQVKEKESAKQAQQNHARSMMDEYNDAVRAKEDLAQLETMMTDYKNRYDALGKQLEGLDQEQLAPRKAIRSLENLLDQYQLEREKCGPSERGAWDSRCDDINDHLKNNRQGLEKIMEERVQMEKEMEEQTRKYAQQKMEFDEASRKAQNIEALEADLKRQKTLIQRANFEYDEAWTKAGEAEKVLSECRNRLSQAEAAANAPEHELRQRMAHLLEEAERRASQMEQEKNAMEAAVAAYQTLLKTAEERKARAEADCHAATDQSKNPEPRNVGHLGRWILHICGAVPVEPPDDMGAPPGCYYCRPPELMEELRDTANSGKKNAQQETNTRPFGSMIKTFKRHINRLFATMDQADFDEYRRKAAAHCYLFANPMYKEVRILDCTEPSQAVELLRDSG